MKPNPMNYKNIKGINNGILHNSTVITCNLFNNNRLQVTCFDFAHLQKADFLTQQNDYLEKDDKENKVWFAFNDNKDTGDTKYSWDSGVFSKPDSTLTDSKYLKKSVD